MTRAAALLFAFCLAAGCLKVRYPAAGDRIALKPDQALVCGRYRVENRVVADPSVVIDLKLMRPEPEATLAIFHVEPNRRTPFARIGKDGFFAWILPRGTYLLYLTRGEEVLYNEPIVAFRVPPGENTVYIGDLTLRTETTAHTARFPRSYDITAIEITDALDVAARELHARFPDVETPPVRELMLSDPGLPGLFGDYSKKRCAAILSRHGWQLQD